MTGPSEDTPPIIGSDIPWSAVRGRGLRVLDCLALAQADKGKDLFGRAHVRVPAGLHPYAVLKVEQAEETKAAGWADRPALFPVCHRDDFRAVDYAMKMLDADTEVIAWYAPIEFPWYLSIVGRFMPVMMVWFCLKGYYACLADRQRRHDAVTEFADKHKAKAGEQFLRVFQEDVEELGPGKFCFGRDSLADPLLWRYEPLNDRFKGRWGYKE